MESTHGVDVHERTVTRFWSGAPRPLCVLSNFAYSPLRIDEIEYTSSEAAFQAQLVKTEYRERLFSAQTEVGQLTESAFVSVGVPRIAAAKKVKYWKAKNQVGILAKMKIKKVSVAHKKTLTRDECESVFKRILLEKYKTNKAARDALLATGDDFLLEFDRGADRKFRRGHITRWAGMVVDGKVVGHNQQGSLQMWVRLELRRLYRLYPM